MSTRCCFWSAVRILGTSRATKRCAPNPMSRPVTNSDLISKALHGSTSSLTNGLLKSGHSVGRRGADEAACMFHILVERVTSLEPSMTSAAHAFFPDTCRISYIDSQHMPLRHATTTAV
jgi:hypothetical protein